MTSDKAQDQQQLILKTFAELAALAMSVEHHTNQALALIPQAHWERLFRTVPSWLDYYFDPPETVLQRLVDSPLVSEAFQPDDATAADCTPEDQFLAALTRAKQFSHATIDMARRIVEEKIVLFDSTSEPFDAEVLEQFSLLRVACADVKARCFYGQGLSDLVTAGQRGNDTGYLYATTIEPVVQQHPILQQRILREAALGHHDFAHHLSEAARHGPSRYIDKDLHQLRYVLSLFRGFGILAQLTNAQRYALFCQQLGLYPDTGENPKAALCTLIKRWEAALVT